MRVGESLEYTVFIDREKLEQQVLSPASQATEKVVLMFKTGQVLAVISTVAPKMRRKLLHGPLFRQQVRHTFVPTDFILLDNDSSHERVVRPPLSTAAVQAVALPDQFLASGGGYVMPGKYKHPQQTLATSPPNLH